MQDYGQMQSAAAQRQYLDPQPQMDKPSEPRMTESMVNRLADMNNSAAEIVARLSATRDRLFGAAPPSTTNGNSKLSPVSNGASDEMYTQANFLSSNIYEALALAGELQSRL